MSGSNIRVSALHSLALGTIETLECTHNARWDAWSLTIECSNMPAATVDILNSYLPLHTGIDIDVTAVNEEGVAYAWSFPKAKLAEKPSIGSGTITLKLWANMRLTAT